MRIIPVLIFFFLNQFSYGQSGDTVRTTCRNAFLGELGGNSRSLMSLNYERLFSLSHETPFYFSLRTGVGYTPGSEDRKIKTTVSVPLVASLLVGVADKHFMHFALGYTASFGNDAIDSTYSPPRHYQKYERAYIVRLGYRFMERKNVLVEAAPVAIWTNNPTSKFEWSFGIGLGLVL